MSTQKVCSMCGAEYPATELFCPRDGSPLKAVGRGYSDLVGQVIAERYHIVRKLGDGGMGQVYLAEHVKMGRKIALKVLRPSIAMEPDAIGRFNREAANASKISHPNVAAVYDFGETPDGVIFLAMEFVDGLPLTKVIEEAGALAAKRAAEIVRQTGDALATAHDMRIVHRDLKPDNIMVAKTRDGGDLVKVVDFGIAKAAGSDSQKVTKTGHVVGTPAYMSPEQLAGDQLDGRSDIYSLGLVAFVMLTGKLPFPAESAQESMIMRLIDRPRPLGQMRPEILWPADVQRVMDKALERDLTRRYQTATDFARDFARAIDAMVLASDQTMAIEAPVRKAPASAASPERDRLRPEDSVARVSRRSPTTIAVAVVAGASVVGALTLWSIRRPTSVAPAPETGAPSATATATRAGRAKSANPTDAGGPTPNAMPTKGAAGGSGNRQTASRQAGDPGTRSFTFPSVNLRVRLAELSQPLRRQIVAAASGIGAVRLLDDANADADLSLRRDPDGKLVVERLGARDAILSRVDTGSVDRTLISLFRRELALIVLSTLDRGSVSQGVSLRVGSGGTPAFALRDTIPIRLRSEQGGYLTLIDVDQAGTMTILHPSMAVDVGRIDPGQEIRFDKEFTASPPVGSGVVRAIITEKPLQLKRDGPVIVSVDGARLSLAVRREVERLVRAGSGRWSTVSIAYTITP